jgi:hypothetical protein
MLSNKFRDTIDNSDIENRALDPILGCLDPFVAAPVHMVCEECDEFISLDEHGFNYDHNCLDPSVIRDDYKALVDRLLDGRKCELGKPDFQICGCISRNLQY